MFLEARKYLSAQAPTICVFCSPTLEDHRVDRNHSTPYSRRVKLPARDKNRQLFHHKNSDSNSTQLKTRRKQPLSTGKIIPYVAKEVTSGIRIGRHKLVNEDNPLKICEQKKAWKCETAAITTSELGNIPNFDILDDSDNLTTTNKNGRVSNGVFSHSPKCFYTRRDNMFSIGNANVETKNKREDSKLCCDKQIQLEIVESHDFQTFGRSNDNDASSLTQESVQVNDVENDITYNEDDLQFLRSFGDTIPSCDGDDDVRENDDFDTLYARPLQVGTRCLNDPASMYNEKSIEKGESNDFTAIQCLVKEDVCPVEIHFNTELRTTVTDILPNAEIVTNTEQTNTDIGDIGNDIFSIDAYSSDEEPTDDFESNLGEAVHKYVASQSMTPIVKQELQLKLQLNRLERGEDELKLEPEAPPIYKLTDEEIRKNNDRREQNRLSAVRCRTKSRDNETVLSQKLDNIATDNASLFREKRELMATKHQLLCELNAHFNECTRRSLVARQMKLIDEEIRKNNDRREQNRLSAVRCPTKSRDYETVLSQKLDNIATENESLSKEKRELMAMKRQLLCELNAHFNECTRRSLVARQLKVVAALL